MALKRNSKAILDVYAEQEDKNITQAYKAIHKDASNITAGVNGWKLLQKPEAQIYLKEHIENARENIVELANSARSEKVRLEANQDILDRAHGKATSRVEATTTGVTLQIDLTSALLEETAEKTEK